MGDVQIILLSGAISFFLFVIIILCLQCTKDKYHSSSLGYCVRFRPDPTRPRGRHGIGFRPETIRPREYGIEFRPETIRPREYGIEFRPEMIRSREYGIGFRPDPTRPKPKQPRYCEHCGRKITYK